MENNATATAIIPTAPNAITFKNPELNRATAELIVTVQSEAKSIMDRAKILHEIHNRKLYAEDGIKNIAEYGQKVFGWGKAYIYQLIGAWDKFGNNPLKLTDGTAVELSAGQYQELAKLTHDEAQALLDEGKISADMSAKAIRAVVAEVMPPEKPKNEKVYMWAPVTPKRNQPETKGTQTEIMAKAIMDGWDFAERVSTDQAVYIVGVLNCTPVMYKRMDEVKPEKADKK